MTSRADELLRAAFGERFVLRAEYRGGEGRTLRVAPADGRAGDLVVKVLPPGVELAEASLAMSIVHPAIPTIREVGELAVPGGDVHTRGATPPAPAADAAGGAAARCAYLVRDHVDGEALAALPAAPAELLRVLQQLLEVLAYVHLRGVLHLDLKPANLVLDGDGRLHVIDFGLGVRRGGAARGGTPFFAAPELLLGLVPDARADLFSVGAMVAHALWPAGAAAAASFVARFPALDFFAAAGLREGDLPAPFGAFVARCVARRPDERFADAQAALEFLCGGSGRPSAALLVPDPVRLFAPELAAAAHAGGGDVVLTGGTASQRRALAMHLVSTQPGLRAGRESRDELRLARANGPAEPEPEPVHVRLPRLDGARLLPHLQQAFGLTGTAATEAAAWLVARAADGAGVDVVLQELVRAGEIVPSGARWTWPAARSGRLHRGAEPPARAPTPALVHAAAASGRREAAIAAWQAGARDPAAEPALRRALAEGLLDGGEPAQALPFCGGDGLLRAQALFDTGQVLAAERALAALPAAALAERADAASAGPHVDAALDAALGGAPGEPRIADAPRARRLRAQVAMARGAADQAIALLEHGGGTLAEAVTLAAALEQAGRVDEAEVVVRRCMARVSPAPQPFFAASAHTVLGHVLRHRGELAAARAQFEIASELLFELGHVRHAATAQLNLGVVAKDLGEHAAAVEHLREARTMFQHVGDEGRAAQAAASLGIAALARGDAAAARPWLVQAAADLLRLGNVAAGALAQAMLARAHAELGEHDEARALCTLLGDGHGDRVRAELARVQALLQRAAPPAADADATLSQPPANHGPSRELFRTLLAVNRHLAQETDLDKAMRRLLDAAVTLSGGRIGYLLVARDDGMRRELTSGDSGPVGQAFSRSLAHRAMQLQRTLTGADALADRDLQDAPSIRNLAIRSAVCAPFRSAGGTLGAIYVEHPGRADAFGDADKEALEMLADQAAIAVDRMLREQELAAELTQSRRELVVARRANRRGPAQLIGDSAAMRDLRERIDKLAALELPVLVLGETGTGKELVARALHERGPRHRGPFVAENCSALPPELMERELFGHVRGAFTGADADRPGLLEIASGGTLFLDEVGDMPPALQAKLLRALQEQSIRRVGGTENVQLDLRLVAATHRDLRAMVQRGEFREDLFFRLAAVELRVPPLRERHGDVAQLAEHFLRRHAQQHGRALQLAPVARAALLAHPWPGNVRELEHVIARAALLCTGDEIVDVQLHAGGATAASSANAANGAPAAPAIDTGPARIPTLKEVERRAMIEALQACGGDKAATARALGISRTALYEKLKRHGIGP